jgi:hypothetical protein
VFRLTATDTKGASASDDVSVQMILKTSSLSDTSLLAQAENKNWFSTIFERLVEWVKKIAK